MDMLQHRNRIAAASISIALYWIVARLMPGIPDAAPFLLRFRWQYRLLLIAAGAVTLLGVPGGAGISRFSLMLRLFTAFPVCFTTGSNPLVPAFFILAVIQESSFRQSVGWSAGIVLGYIIVLLLTVVPERLVFGVFIPGVSAEGLLILWGLTMPPMVLALCFRWVLLRERRWREAVDRLDNAVSKLTETNLGYQGYAQEIRYASIADERRRISREIHDTVGCSLTNIRVMLEAASLKMKLSPGKSLELIEQSMHEAAGCLEQTRAAMRRLRNRGSPAARGLPAIQRLVNAFSETTGIRVKTEYGNVPAEWPEETERAVYRLVQEGMTNAFRHGMATEIMIYFQQDGDALRLTVRDNGDGSAEIKEGLGITGMRERVKSLGGSVQVGPRPDGFEVRAVLPLPSPQSQEKEV